MRNVSQRFFSFAALLAALAFFSTQCVAAPSSARLSVSAQQVRNSPSAPLRLTITSTLNQAPSSSCTVKLYGRLSATDGSSSGGRWLLDSKSSSSRSVQFSYRGPAVRVSQGVQRQLNLQTVSVCGSSSITSNAVAANVTCTRGVSSSGFISLLRARLRNVLQSASTGEEIACGAN